MNSVKVFIPLTTKRIEAKEGRRRLFESADYPAVEIARFTGASSVPTVDDGQVEAKPTKSELESEEDRQLLNQATKRRRDRTRCSPIVVEDTL